MMIWTSLFILLIKYLISHLPECCGGSARQQCLLVVDNTFDRRVKTRRAQLCRYISAGARLECARKLKITCLCKEMCCIYEKPATKLFSFHILQKCKQKRTFEQLHFPALIAIVSCCCCCRRSVEIVQLAFVVTSPEHSDEETELYGSWVDRRRRRENL